MTNQCPDNAGEASRYRLGYGFMTPRTATHDTGGETALNRGLRITNFSICAKLSESELACSEGFSPPGALKHSLRATQILLPCQCCGCFIGLAGGDVVFYGGLLAGVEFGHGTDDLLAFEFEFDGDRAKGGLELFDAAWCLVAAHLVDADAKGGAFLEEQVGEGCFVFGQGKDG